MGHVNHGKVSSVGAQLKLNSVPFALIACSQVLFCCMVAAQTTLLDYLRKSTMAAHEKGGITQSIGAFSVSVGSHQLCVMDTPGHAAFRHMRALGAHLTDIIVLVVSADDSIMPQTLEALRYDSASSPADVPACHCAFVRATGQYDEHSDSQR
jgi:translation initiation factor IF-2